MARNLNWSKHNYRKEVAHKYATKPSESWDKDWYAKNKHLLKSNTETKQHRAGIITFGKYKGKHLTEVPKGYLRWLTQTVDDKPILIKEAKKLLTS